MRFPAMNGRYYGDFKDGQLEGWGEMVFANGDRSTGAGSEVVRRYGKGYATLWRLGCGLRGVRSAG